MIQSKSYKSLRDVNKDYQDYNHHTLRQIYLKTSGVEPRRMHPFNQQLVSMIRIKDAPIKIINLNSKQTEAVGYFSPHGHHYQVSTCEGNQVLIIFL